MSGTDSAFRAWIAKAENDLLNIRNNLFADETPWDTVCFHAEQAAEKALKAFLVSRGEAPPRSHDLVHLVSLCESYDATLSVFTASCERLTYYGVHVRYPEDIYEPTETEARELAELASDLVAGICARLGR
jgi:HEPN domain-containing protein